MKDEKALLSLAIVLLSVVCIASASVQPETRATTNTLDFLVTARGGGMPALSPADISLKIGGRAQVIESVESFTGPTLTRHIMLVVDEGTLYSLEPVVKEAVDKLLASLAPSDLVSFVSTRRGGTNVELTRDRKRITDAVAAMKTGPGVLWLCQTDMIQVLGRLTKDLPKGRGSSIVVISRGDSEGPSYQGDSGGGPCTPKRDDMRRLEEAIAVAQVNLHLFTVADPQHTWSSWGFDNIAGNTGGTSGQLTFSNRDGLVRAIHSQPGYYRATFTWNASTDRAQRVELRTKQKDLKIRTSPWLRAK
jgi:hypothetical protein